MTSSSRCLDLSAVYASYVEERGFPPYDPRLMLKLLIYGYATGHHVVAEAWRQRRIGMWRSGCCVPASSRITERSPGSAPAISTRWPGMFVQSLGLCAGEPGWSGLHALAVDGTKLRAHASQAQGDEL